MKQASHPASRAASTTTLVSRVSKALRSDVLHGDYRSGDKLPSEAQLTRIHGVSRTVIREAIAALRSEGLVEARQGAGVFVLDAISSAFQRSRLDVDRQRLYSSLEILEARTPLEIEAAGLAAQRRSPVQEEEMFEKHTALISCLNDGTHWIPNDIALHLAIARATNNPLFSTFLEMQGNSVIPQTDNTVGNDNDDVITYRHHLIKEHERIVMAIANGDEQGARDAMREHLKGSLMRHRKLLHDERIRFAARLSQQD
ncbi:FadR/GntR family transcriptional regulator [Cohaesibacter celericrescens]|uniref:GntR family transcriptional regulator n=1 Tax=Cohaesibacter celericrescens TaxID=2067669 RepID=A0A2N5XN15_9HYPH|nr:FadR/GntR family transcriptional regulator [Cohaesibacter celericrescens]PLW75919.1 GntR family transcriptional regulator [Cohaesibacter celericrescens]